ncbi:hypothetical protein HDE_06001 [Halotydeus destructor]|nr:hypothetical protein HDE_06001 [Halotydeus destructor]
MLFSQIVLAFLVLICLLPFLEPRRVITTITTHVTKTKKQTKVKTRRKKVYINGILVNTDELAERSVMADTSHEVSQRVEHSATGVHLGMPLPVAQDQGDMFVDTRPDVNTGSVAAIDENSSFGGNQAVRQRGCEYHEDCPTGQYCNANRCRRRRRGR